MMILCSANFEIRRDTMIKEIKVGNIATYSTQVSFQPSTINFIYGSNGVGKSTLTKVISGEMTSSACSVQWDSTEHEEVVAYDHDFIKKNYSESADLPGIFSLGKENVELRKAIQKLGNDIAQKENEISHYNTTLKDMQLKYKKTLSELDDACWDIQQKFSNEFKEALIGYRAEKAKFRTKYLESIEMSLPAITIAEFQEKYLLSFSKTADRMQEYVYLDVDSMRTLQNEEILSKSIIGKSNTPIGKFIEYLKSADWVKQGIGFAKHTNGRCPYCNQAMPHDIERDIEEYFDVTYSRDCEQLSVFHHQYIDAVSAMKTIVIDILKTRLVTFDYNQLELLNERMNATIERNLAIIQEKIESPSKSIELDSLVDICNDINIVIRKINEVVQRQNRLIENQKAAQMQCKEEIWSILAAQDHGHITQLRTEVNNLQRGIDEVTTKIRNINEAINELKKEKNSKESEITSVYPTVHNINKILSCFGFDGFKLDTVPSNPGMYRIIRSNGTDATKTLSEGEYTFITFLYYYYRCFGSFASSGIDNEKVLVIDDPISSLDSAVLFVVATLVKELISTCRKQRNGLKQVFVLTHNVHFHKEVTYLGSREQFSPAEVKYYIIRKKNEISSIYEYPKNPISTSYELLWNDIKTIDNASVQGILNAMRRILEHYFQVVGGINYEKCIASFEGEDKLICKSLVAYINDGSHSIFDDSMIIVDETSIEKYHKVFKMIFEKLGHLEHYNMMMAR